MILTLTFRHHLWGRSKNLNLFFTTKTLNFFSNFFTNNDNYLARFKRHKKETQSKTLCFEDDNKTFRKKIDAQKNNQIAITDDMLSILELGQHTPKCYSIITKGKGVERQKTINQLWHATLTKFNKCTKRNNLLTLHLAFKLGRLCN